MAITIVNRATGERKTIKDSEIAKHDTDEWKLFSFPSRPKTAEELRSKGWIVD